MRKSRSRYAAGPALILNKNIESLQTSFQDGCSTIASAITEMGVATADNASPDEMAENIRGIKANFVSWDSAQVGKEDDYYGAYAHRYSFDVSDIPNISSMTHGKDFFIEPLTLVSSQSGVGGAPTFMDVTDNELHMMTGNGAKYLSIRIYYDANFKV